MVKRILRAKPFGSTELDSTFINADGVRRNIEKLYWEAVWCWQNTKGAWKRLFTDWRIDHNFINILTESNRYAPYLMSHLIGIPLFIWAIWAGVSACLSLM